MPTTFKTSTFVQTIVLLQRFWITLMYVEPYPHSNLTRRDSRHTHTLRRLMAAPAFLTHISHRLSVC
jgi:hypothetical protein